MKSWKEFLERESNEDYFLKLMQKVDEAYNTETIYPSKEEMFSCFDLCPYENVKVVIIGQDPYHGAGQAHGLSFSVKPGVKVPPSLRNIYKELKTDLNIDAPKHGYLASWAKQGVLMMNTSWSVTEGKAGSHKKFGWTKFTQHVLEVLNDYDKPIVFILWGNHAIDAAKGITNPKHFLLKGTHPSPLAGGGFFGSKPFSQTNDFLEKVGRGAIDWKITEDEEVQILDDKKIMANSNMNTTPKNVSSDMPNNGATNKSWPPKFKKVWENIKEVDTSNDLIIREYPGTAIKIIDLEGKQILLAQNKNKLEFLDPYTFQKINKSIILAPSNVSVYKTIPVKINNEWCIVYEVYNKNTENRFQIVVYNFVTKQTTVLEKAKAWVNELYVAETDSGAYAFVVYDTNPGLVVKYNLQTLKEELRFEIPKSDHTYLYYFVNQQRPTILIEHCVSVCPESEYHHYMLVDANTGEQIGQKMKVHEERDEAIVQVSDDKYLLAVATKDNHLLLFDTATGEQTHNILVDEDPEYTIAVFWALTAYKSKLIVASWDRTKVYDLAHPEKEPHLLTHADGSPVQTKGDVYVVEYQGDQVAILPRSYKGPACFSLNTYQELPDMKAIPTMNILPFTDQQNRELFIIKHGEPWGASPYTVLYNPHGRIRPEEEYERNYYAVSTQLNNIPVIITRATNDYINIFDAQTGNEIKRINVENASQIKKMIVTEVKGKQILLALFNEEIKGYALPNMEDTDISFSIKYANNMDIVEMEGKKQLIAANDQIFTWDLETGKSIHTPLHIIEDEDEPEEEDRYMHSDGFSIRKLSSEGKDYLFIGLVESDAYLWYPDQPKELKSLTIDDTMWNVDSEDPDFGIFDAISTKLDGKNIVVTASHHGAVVVFDPKTGKRIGRIMRARSDFDDSYIRIMDWGNHKLLITNDDYNVKIWDLSETKKLKSFGFEGRVTSVTISRNRIIVCHGEDVTAIEVA